MIKERISVACDIMEEHKVTIAVIAIMTTVTACVLNSFVDGFYAQSM